MVGEEAIEHTVHYQILLSDDVQRMSVGVRQTFDRKIWLC